MKRTQWSEFDKFVVMADKYNGYLKADYPAYLDYKVVKSVIIKMFAKLEKGVWDYDIRTLASRLKIKNLKSR